MCAVCATGAGLKSVTLANNMGFLAWALGDSVREIKKGGSCHTSAIWLAADSTEIALDR